MYSTILLIVIFAVAANADLRPSYHPEPKHEEHHVKPYEFGYQVKDDYHGTDYGHHQESDGYVTKGEYRVLLPDGRYQVVSYYADHTGYHPTITYEGEAHHPEHYDKPVTYKPVYKPTYKPAYKPTYKPTYKPIPKPTHAPHKAKPKTRPPYNKPTYAPYKPHYISPYKATKAPYKPTPVPYKFTPHYKPTYEPTYKPTYKPKEAYYKPPYVTTHSPYKPPPTAHRPQFHSSYDNYHG